MGSRFERAPRVETGGVRDIGVHITSASYVLRPNVTGREYAVWHDANSASAVIVDGHRAADATPQLIVRDALSSVHATALSVPGEVSAAIGTAFDRAHDRLLEEAPGSTVSATAVRVVESDTCRVAVIESIGRTRAYLFRNGRLLPATQEDGVPVIENEISKVYAGLDAVRTQEDLDYFNTQRFGLLDGSYFWDKRDTVTRALGKKSVTASMPSIFPVRAGDKVILTDLGVENLTRDEIEAALRVPVPGPAHEIVRRAASAMRDESRVRRDVRDIHAVVLEVEPRLMTAELQGGQEAVIPYLGTPVKVNFTDGTEFEIGKCRDLGIQHRPEVSDLMLIINRNLLRTSGQREGYWWLQGPTFIGHERHHNNWLVHTGNNVSDVKISNDGENLRIQDLHSRSNPRVTYTQ